MDTVPNEVLVLIFSYVANKELLKCRLVSQIWKENASHMCRRKGVRLRLKRADLNNTVTDNLQVIFQTFLDLDNLPWSNCCLGSWRHTRRRNIESLKPHDIGKFVGIFGPHLRALKIFGDDFKIFMEILPGLPNLEVLTSRVESVSDKIHRIQPSTVVKPLKMLKIFQSRVSAASDVQFIQAIMDNIPSPSQVDDFVLNITGEPHSWENVDQCAQLASLMASITSTIILTIQTYLTAQAAVLRAMALKNLKVREIAIFIENLESNDSGYFAPLEDFLASITPGLVELDIVDKRRLKLREIPMFKIPVLPELRQMKLQGDITNVGPTFPYLSGFKADQFPKLDKVQISKVYGHQFQVFDSCSLSSVRLLEFCDEEDEEEITLGGDWDFKSKSWKEIFPNLTTLKAEIWDQESLQYIFNHMADLTHLTLRIIWGRIDYLESILSGTIKEYSFHTLLYKSLNPALPTPRPASLHSMTQLKTLNMNFVPRCDYRIRDKFVENTLLKIQPLEVLTISAKVSKESVAKLRGYHQQIELTRHLDHSHDKGVDYGEDDESEENEEEEENDDDGEENGESDDQCEEDGEEGEEENDEGEGDDNEDEGDDDEGEEKRGSEENDDHGECIFNGGQDKDGFGYKNDEEYRG